MPTQDDVIPRILQAAPELKAEGGAIILPNTGARMTIPRAMVGGDDTTAPAALHVLVEHPSWDRPFFDVVSGLGSTSDEGLGRAILNLCLHVVHLIDHGEEPVGEFETRWAGARHRWQVLTGYSILTTFDKDASEPPPSENYWPMFSEAIKQRLGNQAVSYLKVFGALMNGRTIAEVRFNNVVSPDMSDILREHIRENWPSRNLTSKQIIWLQQDPDTRLPYPYTAADFRRFVVEAGRLFLQMSGEDGNYDSRGNFDRNKYRHRLTGIFGDPSLAAELVQFLPEIVCTAAYPQVALQETATLKRDVGSEEVINTNQLACWAHMTAAVDAEWCEGLTREVIMALAAYSASGDILQQITRDKIEVSPEKPVHMSMTYSVGESYRMR